MLSPRCIPGTWHKASSVCLSSRHLAFLLSCVSLSSHLLLSDHSASLSPVCVSVFATTIIYLSICLICGMTNEILLWAGSFGRSPSTYAHPTLPRKLCTSTCCVGSFLSWLSQPGFPLLGLISADLLKGQWRRPWEEEACGDWRAPLRPPSSPWALS